jgi:hypothetical protein
MHNERSLEKTIFIKIKIGEQFSGSWVLGLNINNIHGILFG